MWLKFGLKTDFLKKFSFTDIVISSNVVTETVAPTPTLPDGGLASSDYVNTFA